MRSVFVVCGFGHRPRVVGERVGGVLEIALRAVVGECGGFISFHVVGDEVGLSDFHFHEFNGWRNRVVVLFR